MIPFARRQGPSRRALMGRAPWQALVAVAGLLVTLGGALYLSRSMAGASVDAAVGRSEAPGPEGGPEGGPHPAAPEMDRPAGAALGPAPDRAPVAVKAAGGSGAAPEAALSPEWTGPPDRARIRLLVERGGAPLAGCRVAQEGGKSAVFEGHTGNHGVTDAQGRISLIARPGRTLRLSIQDPEEVASISKAITSPFAQRERLVRVSFPEQASVPKINVHVVDALTGGPLPNTEVTFHSSSGLTREVTDQEGNARVPLAKGESVWFEREGFCGYTLRHHPSFANDGATVELIPKATIYGRVAGEVPAGAIVEVRFQAGGSAPREPGVTRFRQELSEITAQTSVLVDGSWEITDLSFPEGCEVLERGTAALRAGRKSRVLAAELRIQPRDRLHVPDELAGGQPMEIEVLYPGGEPVLGQLRFSIQKVGEDRIRHRPEPIGPGRFRMSAAPLGEWSYTLNYGISGKLIHDGKGPVTVVLENAGSITVQLPELPESERVVSVTWEPTSAASGGRPPDRLVDVGTRELLRLDGIPLGVPGRVVVRSARRVISVDETSTAGKGANLKAEYPILAEAPARAGGRGVKPVPLATE